jgi:proteasome lid subunit RPN8/RPN11
MFGEEPPRPYPWNSDEDMRLRMNLLIDNHHACWKNEDFNCIESKDDGYETA